MTIDCFTRCWNIKVNSNNFFYSICDADFEELFLPYLPIGINQFFEFFVFKPSIDQRFQVNSLLFFASAQEDEVAKVTNVAFDQLKEEWLTQSKQRHVESLCDKEDLEEDAQTSVFLLATLNCVNVAEIQVRVSKHRTEQGEDVPAKDNPLALFTDPWLAHLLGCVND